MADDLYDNPFADPTASPRSPSYSYSVPSRASYTAEAEDYQTAVADAAVPDTAAYDYNEPASFAVQDDDAVAVTADETPFSAPEATESFASAAAPVVGDLVVSAAPIDTNDGAAVTVPTAGGASAPSAGGPAKSKRRGPQLLEADASVDAMFNNTAPGQSVTAAKGAGAGGARKTTAATGAGQSTSTGAQTTSGGQQGTLDHMADVYDEPVRLPRNTQLSHYADTDAPAQGQNQLARYKDVTVTEPERVADGMNSHIVYRVACQSAYINRWYVCKRRYSDFVWLFNTLMAKHPGAIIPPLPEKKAIGRFEAEFIEHRYGRAQTWPSQPNYRRKEPVDKAAGSVDLATFFEADQLDTTKAQASGDDDKGLLTSLFKDDGPFTKGLEAFLSFILPTTQSAEDDGVFEKRKRQLNDLDAQLKQLLKLTESIGRHNHDLFHEATAFWTAATAMGGSPEPLNGGFVALAHLGALQPKIEAVRHQDLAQYASQFGDIVDDYVRTIASVRVAFTARAKVLDACKDAKAKLHRARERMDKAITSNRTDQVTEATREVEHLSREAERNERSLKQISDVLEGELVRFQDNLQRELSSSVAIFVEHMRSSVRQVSELLDTYSPPA